MILRVAGCLAVISAYFMLFRGIGRFVNPNYKAFIDEYFRVKANSTAETRRVRKRDNQTCNRIRFDLFRIFFRNMIFPCHIGRLIIPLIQLLFVVYR